MRVIRPAILVALLLLRPSLLLAQVVLPVPAREAIKQLEDESAAVENKLESDVKKLRKETAAELKRLQDRLCREDKLDEALAVRALLRDIQSGGHDERRLAALEPDPADFVRDFLTAAADAAGLVLPEAARDVRRKHDQAVDDLYRDAEAKVKKYQDKAAAELEKAIDKFRKDARLDEALAVRNMLRQVRAGGTMVLGLPDPGYVNHPYTDVGKVFYFEVTGVTSVDPHILLGTDVYAGQSSLAMAAVHAGVLKEGQTGVVKVTVLPGRSGYDGSTRRGVTSTGWGPQGVSFKVERPRGVAVRVTPPYLPDPGDTSHLQLNVGKVYLFEVTGSKEGCVWGTGAYSSNSPLATAAVHAGVLAVGQKGVVKVTILPGQDKYEGSRRNGITSETHPFGGGYSFKVEPAR